MTSTSSKNKTNVFWTRVCQHIKSSMSFAMGICIIMLFSSVVNIMEFARYPEMRNYYGQVEEFGEEASQVYFTLEDLAISVFSTGTSTVCMILAALIAIKCFRHMHKKSIVDTEYALPITTNQRFLASLTATFVLIIGATLVSALLTHLLAYSMLNDSTDFGKMFSNSGGNFADVADLFLKYHMVSLSEMLLLVATGILALSCCGILFDAVVYAGGASLLVVGTILATQTVMRLDHLKYVESSFGGQWVSYLTPFYTMLGTYLNYIYLEGVVDLSPLTSLCIGRYLISAALCVAAFFIHRKRRAESVGKPFTFKPFYYAVTTLLIFCLIETVYCEYLQSTLNNYTDYSYKSTGIMVGMIMFFGFLVLEVLAERKSVFTKKRAIQGVVRFAVTVPLCIAAVYGVHQLGKRTPVALPDADEIETISISCIVSGGGVEYMGDDGIEFDETKVNIDPAVLESDRFDNICEFSNKEQFEAVLEFAQKINEFEKGYLEENGEFYKFEAPENFDSPNTVYMGGYIDIYTRDGDWIMYYFDLSQDFVKQWLEEEYLVNDELYGEYVTWY